MSTREGVFDDPSAVSAAAMSHEVQVPVRVGAETPNRVVRLGGRHSAASLAHRCNVQLPKEVVQSPKARWRRPTSLLTRLKKVAEARTSITEAKQARSTLLPKLLTSRFGISSRSNLHHRLEKRVHTMSSRRTTTGALSATTYYSISLARSIP
jgi:hypothetical protein